MFRPRGRGRVRAFSLFLFFALFSLASELVPRVPEAHGDGVAVLCRRADHMLVLVLRLRGNPVHVAAAHREGGLADAALRALLLAVQNLARFRAMMDPLSFQILLTGI